MIALDFAERPYVLVRANCLDVFAEMPPASLDAIVADPPFFMPAVHYSSRVEWGRKWTDALVLSDWWRMVVRAAIPALKPTGHFVVFCSRASYAAFYPTMFEEFGSATCLVWDKTRPGLGWHFRYQHELIIHGHNAGAYRPDDGKLRVDVLKHPATLSRNRKHPVEKPVALLRELIEGCCPPGGVVCDPFMGSGTTGVAAIEAGRLFVGIEADADYMADAADYLAAVAHGGGI